MKKLLLLCIIFLACTESNAQDKKAYTQKENTIRIMSYNVRNGMGLDNVTSYERMADVINSLNPQILVLQELDSVTNRSKQKDVLKELSLLTNMYPVYGSAIVYDGGKYGIGLLAKEPPLTWKNVPLPGREEKRTLLIVEFEKYIVCATHWSLTEEDRKSSIKILNSAVKEYDKPVFLSGDLNALPNSEEIKELKKNWKMLSDPKAPTYPANKPRSTIDYIFGYTAKGQSYSVSQTKVVNEPLASDHRPVFVDVE